MPPREAEARMPLYRRFESYPLILSSCIYKESVFKNSLFTIFTHTKKLLFLESRGLQFYGATRNK